MKRYKGILALKANAREKTKPLQPPHGLGSDLVGESVVAICWRAEKFIGLPKPGLIHWESKKLPSRMQANCSQWASNTEGVGAPVMTRGVCSVHNRRAKGLPDWVGTEMSPSDHRFWAHGWSRGSPVVLILLTKGAAAGSSQRSPFLLQCHSIALY